MLRSSPLAAVALAALLTVPALARGQGACPTDWRDAGVAIADPQPIAPAGVPEARIDALDAFVRANGVGDVEGLLAALPAWLLESYVLVETSGTTHPASVSHPRLLLFGSDARFLLALGSDPDDPAREVVDLAELRDDGSWKLRSLDFRNAPPTLSADDAACTGCHGDPARPFWGSYPSWPGMFGAQQDRVSAVQAERLAAIRADPEASDRFFAIDVPPPFGGDPWQTGDVLRLPGRLYPFTNTVLNLELGAAVADGAFRRLRAAPDYPALRDELLTLSYCALRDASGYVASGARDAVTATLLAAGVAPASRDALYRHLGVDADETFSLHRLASEPPDSTWNVSTDSLPGLVNLLLLDDWMREDAALLHLLEAQPDVESAFNRGCFDHVADAIRHKVHLGWTLRGAARQASRAAAFDLDLLRATQGVLDPIRPALCPFLYERVQAPPTTAAPACADGADNDGDGWTDFPADPGCASATAGREDPACSDGLDNDRDGWLDAADPACVTPSGASESSRGGPGGCGLGPELAALVGLLGLARRRVPRATSTPHPA